MKIYYVLGLYIVVSGNVILSLSIHALFAIFTKLTSACTVFKKDFCGLVAK